MNNKGFSMVELIIVIAIMVIVSGALAPMLIQYISKSRLNADIDTGAAVGRAIMAAVTNKEVYDDAVEHTTPYPINSMDGDEFKNEVFGSFGTSRIDGKSTKDCDGNPFDSDKCQFYYTLDAARNRVEVYYGGLTTDYQIYPVLGSKMSK